MKPVLIATFCGCLVTAPVVAQDDNPPKSGVERGIDLFFDRFMQEMEPAIDNMRSFMSEMGPAMREILDEVEDWSVYAPPEKLPNGDIIIRRKQPKPDMPEKAPEDLPGEAIDI